MTTDITTIPLTELETTRLVELENTIQAGIATFMEVGTALAEIRNSKLYRQTHATWEAYLGDRWAMSREYGWRLVQSSSIARALAVSLPMGNIPNERQARELVGLPAEQAVEVYKQAVAETAGRTSARKIREARQAKKTDQAVDAEAQVRNHPKLGPGIDRAELESQLVKLTQVPLRFSVHFPPYKVAEIVAAHPQLKPTLRAAFDEIRTWMANVENAIDNVPDGQTVLGPQTAPVGSTSPWRRCGRA